MFQEELNREQVKSDLLDKISKLSCPPESIRTFRALSLFLKTAEDVSIVKSEAEVIERVKKFGISFVN